MSRFVDLTTLRADVTFQMDMAVAIGSGEYVTTDELDRLIVQSSRIWLGEIIGASGTDRYFETTTTLSYTSSSSVATLPTDFYQLYQAAATIDGHTFPIYPATVDERAYGLNDPDTYYWRRPGYRITKGTLASVLTHQLEMVPAPQASYSVQIWYAPTTIAVNGAGDTAAVDIGDNAATDVIDGVNGWEQWIVWDVCSKLAIKQEMDASPYEMQKAQIEARIKRYIGERDRGPKRVRDTWLPGLWDPTWEGY